MYKGNIQSWPLAPLSYGLDSKSGAAERTQKDGRVGEWREKIPDSRRRWQGNVWEGLADVKLITQHNGLERIKRTRRRQQHDEIWWTKTAPKKMAISARSILSQLENWLHIFSANFALNFRSEVGWRANRADDPFRNNCRRAFFNLSSYIYQGKCGWVKYWK